MRDGVMRSRTKVQNVVLLFPSLPPLRCAPLLPSLICSCVRSPSLYVFVSVPPLPNLLMPLVREAISTDKRVINCICRSCRVSLRSLALSLRCARLLLFLPATCCSFCPACLVCRSLIDGSSFTVCVRAVPSAFLLLRLILPPRMLSTNECACDEEWRRLLSPPVRVDSDRLRSDSMR